MKYFIVLFIVFLSYASMLFPSCRVQNKGKRQAALSTKYIPGEESPRRSKFMIISNQDESALSAFFDFLRLTYSPVLLFDLHDPEVINSKRIREGEGVISRNDIALNSRYAKHLHYDYQKEKRKQTVPSLCIKYISRELGYGLFADQDFKRGDFVGEYCGVVTTKPSRYSFPYNCTYFDDIAYDEDAPEFVIAPRPIGNECQFINHHEDPNVELVPVVGCDGRRHIILIACKKISKGTQLFVNYGEEYWKHNAHKTPKKLDS